MSQFNSFSSLRLRPFAAQMRVAAFFCAALCGTVFLSATSHAQAPDKEDKLVRELLDGTDDLYRSQASIAVVEMHVQTKHYKRALKMKMWTKGTEKSLIRILKPKKEKGVTTLKVNEDVWNYLPKVNRVIKIPSSMMSGSWMGSHLTNDDLVKESRFTKDFTFHLKARPKEGKGDWVIEAIPKPNAAVVWGKVVVTISADRLPKKQEYFDEKGRLIRTMEYLDVKEFSGKKIPSVMRLTPANKPGEFTEFIQLKLELDAKIDDSLFSLQSLKR